MGKRIPLTEEMIIELLQLKDEGKGLRPLGEPFWRFSHDYPTVGWKAMR